MGATGTLVLAPLGAAEARPRGLDGGGVRVVFVGGLGTSAATTSAVFGELARALGEYAGYAEADLLTFDYGERGACQSIAPSAAQLADYLRRLRSSGQATGVVLVGHSMGGVVALDTATTFDDLSEPDTGFIKRVLTIDSPLGGLSTLQRALIAELWLGECPAADDSVARYVDYAWPSTLSARVERSLGRGVEVFAVANPDDLLLTTRSQQVPGVRVNVTLSATDDAFGHTALLNVPSALSTLVTLIGPRA